MIKGQRRFIYHSVSMSKGMKQNHGNSTATRSGECTNIPRWSQVPGNNICNILGVSAYLNVAQNRPETKIPDKPGVW